MSRPKVNALIINCYSKANVNGQRAGGIADNFNGTIVNCWSYCNLTGEQTGGIVSFNALSMKNCFVVAAQCPEKLFTGSEYINIDQFNSGSLTKKLNNKIYESAMMGGVSVDALNKWKCDNVGSPMFSDDKGDISSSDVVTLIYTNIPLILTIVCLLMTIYIYSKYKLREDIV